MNIRNQQHIRVFNYSPNRVCFNSRNGREYNLDPCRDGVPSMEYLSWEDIEWLNSKGNIFRSGVLRVDPALEDEIFEALGDPRWKDAMFSEERIRELILNPTPENIEVIIGITSASTIERIRGAMHVLLMSGANVSSKTESTINARASEIRDGKYKSALVVKKHDEPKKDESAQTIEDLKQQIQALTAMFEAQAAQAAQPVAVKPEPKPVPKPTPKKPSSSKPKTTKK